MNTKALKMAKNATKLTKIIIDALPGDATLSDVGLALMDIFARIYADIYKKGTKDEDQKHLSAYASAVYALVKEYREQNRKNS